MTTPDYDVVVVGARAAGASTAMLLAKAGQRVLLVDRASLPSEIAQGHFIYRHAPRRLKQWGLLDAVIASGSPPITTLTMNVGDFPLVARDLSIDGVPWGIGPRRGVFDRILLEAAIDAGVEVEDQVAVDDVLTENGRVSGIHGKSARTGAPVRVTAHLTIGADGRHSRIAQAVQAPMYEQVPTLACWYFSYWSGVPIDGIELHIHERRAIFAFPTNDDLTAIFVAFPINEFAKVRSHPEGSVLGALTKLAPDLAQRVRGGRREERMYGTADMPNFLRKPYGPGWALVGDAGCNKDPMLALGICHALHDAELLAETAHAGLSGERPLDDALTGYEVRRNAATLPDYYENLQMAKLQPNPPEIMALRAALRERPEDCRQFAMAAFGVIPRETFFNPDNMQRIIGQAASAA